MLVFRLPGKRDFFTVKAEDAGENCVTFTTFEGAEALKFCGDFIKATAEDFEKLDSAFANFQGSFHLREDSKIEYCSKVLEAKEFLQNQNAEKIVLSRRKLIDLPSDFSLAASVKKMASAYPQALVYAFVEENQSWMGGFSEVLGKYNYQTALFETMSLAGTLPLNEDWTEKEYSEQATVTVYIHQILESMATEISTGQTQDAASGHIKHLKTEFSAKVSKEKVSDLILKLHPTPAVCGIPKDLCQQEIALLEGQQRRLYAGYITVKTKEDLTAYVNLRCAQFSHSQAALYVGGGLNLGSDPEKEWLETELKAQAVLDNLATREG